MKWARLGLRMGEAGESEKGEGYENVFHSSIDYVILDGLAN
jgi:hypothetical protein